MIDLHLTASSYASAGLSVIPTLPDKRPACKWNAFRERAMNDREIQIFFTKAHGIGIVTGKVSGNLELIDFDDKGSRFKPWMEKIPPYIKQRLVIETTPSGGRHVYYRVQTSKDHPFSIPGNRKLAMTSNGHVLIETRGEGGYVKCAPSEGYRLIQCDFFHVPTISPLEEQLLIDAAKELDEKDTVDAKAVTNSLPVKETPPVAPSLASNQLTPWDDYAQRGDIASLLESHGWKRTQQGSNEHWERPGKNERSTSATWNGEVFYVFSSNAMPFEPNKGYNKFQVYAMLECGGDMKMAARMLRNQGYGGTVVSVQTAERTVRPPAEEASSPDAQAKCCSEASLALADPGPIPEALLHVPGFVDMLAEYTLSCAPYPNRALAFAGSLTMLAHLTGRKYRDERNIRTNLYLLALADSGVGKDFPRQVNMRLATELDLMHGMADRFASAEGLEDALLLHPCSFFQVDEIDTLFASLAEKGDSAVERVYGSLLQFATAAASTFAMRKKAIQQKGGNSAKFEKARARGIIEPHLVMLGTAIPKYLFSALSERSMENGLLSRCLVIEAGPRGKAGTPHFEAFPADILEMAKTISANGGFEGLDIENPEMNHEEEREVYVVADDPAATARREEIIAETEALYDNSKTTSERALWSRAAEKAFRLALLYAISENARNPIITKEGLDWAWKLVSHMTRRMLYMSSIYIFDNEFDALRQKAIRYLLESETKSLKHSRLLKRLHIDADTFRRLVDTLKESELIRITIGQNGSVIYTLTVIK